MDNFIQFLTDAVASIRVGFDQFLKGVSVGQLTLVAALLAILALIMIIALIVTRRHYNDALDTIDKQVDDIVAAKKDAQAKIDQKLAEHKNREADMIDQVSRREAEAANKAEAAQQELSQQRESLETQFKEKEDELERLREFYNNYSGINDVKAETKRMLSEATEYINQMKVRADQHCSEIISHAQKEAASIREMADGTMARSHELLKNAMQRATQIIDDARVDASVFSQSSSSSVVTAQPADLLPAPDEAEAETAMPSDEKET